MKIKTLSNKLKKYFSSSIGQYKYPDISKISARDIKDIKIINYVNHMGDCPINTIQLLINKAGAEWTINMWDYKIVGSEIKYSYNMKKIWAKIKDDERLAGKMFGIIMGMDDGK